MSARRALGGAAQRLALEGLGWLLVVAGIAAIFLPGPGLLMLFAGLAVLAKQYEWAGNRVRPVEIQALKAAAEGVATWPRIIVSTLLAVGVAGLGVIWLWEPSVPPWWPLADRWWLPGGLATGITQIASAFIAVGLIVYSYRRFHGKPEAVAEIETRAAKRAERTAERRRSRR